MIAGMPLVDSSVWFTLTEAAAFLGVTKGRVAALVRDGRFKSERVGRSVFVLRSQVEAYRQSPRKPGRPPTKPKRGK